MFGGDEQMQPGFVDFQHFAQGFASREAIFLPGRFKKPTRWDFARDVIQGWDIDLRYLCPSTQIFKTNR